MVTALPWPDHLLTLDEWIALPQDNSHRYELAEGVLIVSPRSASKHQRAMWRMAAQLEPQLSATYGVLTEAEVVVESLWPSTVRVPDVIAVLAAGVEENLLRWNAADVLLAMEILAPESKRTDRTTKFAEYADAGIEHYWLVDLEDPVSLTANRLVDRNYQLMSEHTGRATLELVGTAITLDLPALISNRA